MSRTRTTFGDLLALDQDARREWLRAWMARHGLETANQAAPYLCVTRTTMERMVYDQARRSAVTDQTLKIAWMIDRYGLQTSA